MSYIINKTDGTILTEIVDGSIDQTATDLTLIGKNASSYGTFIDENFVFLLENFANINEPNYPITGQLWFDTAEGRLKVYDGSSFKVSGGTIVSPTIPSSFTQGDLWIDSYKQQFYFNDGSATTLVGPHYSKQQGISGQQVVDILDINGNTHTVVMFYVSSVLIGIFSKSLFTPKFPISGYAGEIKIGFNSGSYVGVMFHSNTSSANALLDPSDGSLKTVSDFIPASSDAIISGQMTILNAMPLVLGTNSSNSITVNDSEFSINSNVLNQKIKINVKTISSVIPAITIDPSIPSVGIFNPSPTATLDITGNVKTTSGVIIGSDGNCVLSYNTSLSNLDIHSNINLPTGKSYKINGNVIVDESTLGSTVLHSSLTSVGTLTTLNVSHLKLIDSTLAYNNDSLANGTISLVPKGSGTVDVSNKKITSLSDPSDGTDAVNLQTLTTTMKLRSTVVSLNTTGLTNEEVASIYLIKLFPTSEFETGALCRAVCASGATTNIRLFMLESSGIWVFQNIIS